MVSSTTGKSGYLRATSSNWAARWRWCHSGDRRPGWRRGNSSARAAHSRNRDANSAEPPTSAVTMGSISSGSKTNSPPKSGGAPTAPGGASPESDRVSGNRTTMPSSEAVGFSSRP